VHGLVKLIEKAVGPASWRFKRPYSYYR